jgi:hypothetical protein
MSDHSNDTLQQFQSPRYYFREGTGLEGGVYGRRFENTVKRVLFCWSVNRCRKRKWATSYQKPLKRQRR